MIARAKPTPDERVEAMPDAGTDRISLISAAAEGRQPADRSAPPQKWPLARRRLETGSNAPDLVAGEVPMAAVGHEPRLECLSCSPRTGWQ